MSKKAYKMKQASASMHTGIDKDVRKVGAEALSINLANSYMLYLKTQNYHWNVTGPEFHQLHLLFEAQYRDLFEAIDTIAERIRALGIYAPGTFKQFAELSTIKEESEIPKSRQMIENLMNDNETLIEQAREVAELAEDNKDGATADLMISRMAAHEKNAWMLRSLIQR